MTQQLHLQIQVQVLVLPTTDGHVAQCVNFDFAAQGRTVEQSLARFQKAFLAQVVADLRAKRLPFSTFKQTPVRYQLMFERAWLRYGPLGLPVPAQLQGELPTPPNINDVRVWAAQSWAA